MTPFRVVRGFGRVWVPNSFTPPALPASDSQPGPISDPSQQAEAESVAQIDLEPEAASIAPPAPISSGPIVPAEEQSQATANSCQHDAGGQARKRGRKPASESHAAEIRARLSAWKQVPETQRMSLRALAAEMRVSHQLLSFHLRRLALTK
jgi:hypothetical protein